jgi:hypothetical protein
VTVLVPILAQLAHGQPPGPALSGIWLPSFDSGRQQPPSALVLVRELFRQWWHVMRGHAHTQVTISPSVLSASGRPVRWLKGRRSRTASFQVSEEPVGE